MLCSRVTLRNSDLQGPPPVRCESMKMNLTNRKKSQNWHRSVHVKLSKGLIRGCIGVSQPPQVIRPLQALLDLVLVFHPQAK